MVSKRVTKKVKGNSKSFTLGSLRKALEHIKACARSMSVEQFQKEYKKVFGKQLSSKQAKEYMHSLKSKAQKGGAAPLQYDLRAGADTPYGSFPQYLTGGFGFANVSSTLGEAAGVTNFGSPARDMGSNLVGGKRRSRKNAKKMKGGGLLDSTLSNVAEIMSRPFPALSPATIGNDVQLLAHGLPGFASPRPEFNTPNIPMPNMVNSMQASPASKLV